MAIKIDKRAAYIGTVMNALTDFPTALALVENRRQKDLNLVDGGVGWARRRFKDPGVNVP